MSLLKNTTKKLRKSDDEVDRKLTEHLNRLATQQMVILTLLADQDLDADTTITPVMLNSLNLDQLEVMAQGLLPIIKVRPRNFLIGTELKQLTIQSDQLMVRVGGGFEELGEYLKKYS